MTVSLDDQIACVRREIGLRERVYPKWVAAGKMKADAADQEIARMRAVIETLESVRALFPAKSDPRLEQAKTLVLWFANDADREAIRKVLAKAVPEMKAEALPR